MACDICGGTGRISLRVRTIDEAPSMVEQTRRYPCPECRTARAVDPQRVTAIRVNETIDTKHMRDPYVVNHHKAKLARLIAKILVQRNLVTVTQAATPNPERRLMEMTVGLIRPKGVKAPVEIQEVEVTRDLPPIPEEFRPPKPKLKPGVRHLILD